MYFNASRGSQTTLSKRWGFMKTLVKISFVVVILSQVMFAQEKSRYFPHHIGDKWQWSASLNDTTLFDVITDTAKLFDESIDVYLNNSKTPRYNVKNNGNVYQYFGDNTLGIWYDFTVSPGDTFYTTIYSAPYFVTVDSLQVKLFGEVTQIRVFKWYSQSNRQSMGE